MTANMPNADLLDDLCTRFILNVPAEELQWVSASAPLSCSYMCLGADVRACHASQVSGEIDVPCRASSLVL